MSVAIIFDIFRGVLFENWIAWGLLPPRQSTNQSKLLPPTPFMQYFFWARSYTTAHTCVFTQICAARLIEFFVSPVRRLFKSRIPQRQNILIVEFNLLNEYFFMVYRLKANLSFGFHNRFPRTLHSMLMSWLLMKVQKIQYRMHFILVSSFKSSSLVLKHFY